MSEIQLRFHVRQSRSVLTVLPALTWLYDTLPFHISELLTTPLINNSFFSNTLTRAMVQAVSSGLSLPRPGLIQNITPFDVGLMVDRWHWDTFFSEYFGFPLLVSFRLSCVVAADGIVEQQTVRNSGVPRNFVRGVQQIQLTEDRENGDLGAVAP